MELRGLLAVFIASILVSSLSVYAIGDSTAAPRTTERTISDNNSQTARERIAQLTSQCEEPENRRERILCRLKNNLGDGDYPETSIPESCRNLGFVTREECRGFYNRVEQCYDLSGRTKDACFKRIAGFSQASLGGESDKAAIKNYAVALLYELQERVESLNEEGALTNEQTADLVALIVNAKEDILEGASREEVREAIQALKAKWREIRGEISIQSYEEEYGNEE